MAARSTNRFKQKPAVPFGDFMLPILGVVALGIVVVGLRILWGPSSPKSNLIAQPRPSASQSLTATQETKSDAHAVIQGITKQEEINDVVIAQPVQSNAEKMTKPTPDVPVTENKNPADVPEVPATPKAPAESKKTTESKAPVVPKAPAKKQPQPAAKSEPKKSSAPKQTAVHAGSIDKSQFVVQCGSYSELSSANSVVASLKKIGLMAVVRRAEVRGKTYFRVVVAGGNDRAVAEEVAKKVQEAGHPVLVRAND